MPTPYNVIFGRQRQQNILKEGRAERIQAYNVNLVYSDCKCSYLAWFNYAAWLRAKRVGDDCFPVSFPQ